ncbi:MAG: hypothetical protein IPL40_06955 [Proteobacteria bacterium]|nr:hypothetical protein [Pseudomonadota bacterium]
MAERTINQVCRGSSRAPIGFVLAALLSATAACSSYTAVGPDVVTGVNPDGSPRWVNRGSGLWQDGAGKAFFGVGLVQGIASESLSRQTADNRARGEIARLFDLYVAALMRDYQRASSSSVAPDASAEEQDVLSVQQTLTSVTLRGVEIVDHWVDPATRTRYALARLDLAQVPPAVAAAPGLSPHTVAHVRQNAERAFGELAQALKTRPTAAAGALASDAPPTAEASGRPEAPGDAENPGDAEAPSDAESAPETGPTAAPRAEPLAAARPEGAPPRLGLRVTGRDAKTIQTCFASRLLAGGHELIEDSSDVEVAIGVELRYEALGQVGGVAMVRAVLDLRAQQTADNRTLLAVAERLKVGRPTLQQAVLSASAKLCDTVVPKLVEQLNQALGR